MQISKPCYTAILHLFLLLCNSIPIRVSAQELNCSVQILTQQIEGTDKKIFETMRQSIYEFMNNRKWTNDIYKNEERIECTMTITMKNRPSIDEFTGSVQIQINRPVFNSGYNSFLLNFNDQDFSIRYVEYQQLDFTENQNLSNLTSILSFYANIILGVDYDSYSLYGGTTYFLRAKAIVSNCQNAQEPGWKPFENTHNRYWLAEDLLDPKYSPVRECIYKFHRMGLDRMYENPQIGRGNILDGIMLLEKVHKDKPSSFLMQVFFDAKANEIINIFSGAYPNEKSQIVPLLTKIDAVNSIKYQKILK